MIKNIFKKFLGFGLSLLLLTIVAVPLSASAAIAFDTSVTLQSTTGTSLTWSHTTSGSNRLLFVYLRSTDQATDNVTGVTYNGVAMTKINTITGDAFIRRTTSTWILVNPAIGANNIVVSGSPSAFISGMSASYTGVAQTGQPDAQTTQNSGASPVSKAITTVANNSWVLVGSAMDNNTPTNNTGITFRQSTFNVAIGDSNAPVTPAGAYTMAANGGSSGSLVLLMVSIAPAVTTSSGDSMRMGMGF